MNICRGKLPLTMAAGRTPGGPGYSVQTRNIVMVLLASLAPLLSAADLAPFIPTPDMRGDWPMSVDPNLPNVLLLGDSISLATRFRCGK